MKQSILDIMSVLLLLSIMQITFCLRSNVLLLFNVAAILQLQFTLYVMLFPMLNVLHFYISTFRSVYVCVRVCVCVCVCAVPNMTDFCSPLIYCFPDMLLYIIWTTFRLFHLPLLLLV